MPPTSLSILLTFPFKDPAWFKKLLILGLVLLLSSAIPILPVILATGYLSRLIRRMVLEKGEPALPAWDDLGGIFQDGWRPFAAALTYLLPLFALFFAGWLVIGLSNSFEPMFQMWFNDRNISPGEFIAIASSFAFLGSFTVGGVLALIVSFLLPAALIHTAVRGEYAAAFRIKEWWKIITANLSGFLIAYAVTLGLSLVVGFLYQILFFTIILCFLLPFLGFAWSSYSSVVFAGLFAEAYRVGQEKKFSPPSHGDNQGKPDLEGEVKPKEIEPGEPALPTAEPEPDPKPARKPIRKASADETLVQPVEPKPEVDTLPLPPPPPVPGVDTVVLPPPASVPGIDTLPLPPNPSGDQTLISPPQTGEKPD